jgi:hypothetical protein
MMLCFLKINCALDYKSQSTTQHSTETANSRNVLRVIFIVLQGDCNKSSLPVESLAIFAV